MRRIAFRMQTHDTRSFLVAEVVRRARAAVVRAGGMPVGGEITPPKRIKRWCVNRSPHVNKTSREHFWMITHTRVLRFDAGPDMSREAPYVIASNLPPIVATRVQEEVPALMALADTWQLRSK